MFRFSLLASLSALLALGCARPADAPVQPPQTTAPSTPSPIFVAAPASAGFNDYWFQGKAEIALYDVTQERYGADRPAEQVMIFVTEDFSARKQVKLDAPDQAGNDRVPVLKLNTIRRFHTGVYDYSLMQSVFTPLDAQQHPFTLKTTTSVQDWCGHVFEQTNFSDNQYRLREFSYFETEGDQDLRLPAAMLEDELWVRLRLNPEGIPTGAVQVIPAAFYTRLRHQPAKVQAAQLTRESDGQEGVLRLRYRDIPRELVIRYAAAFPHRILAWEERDGDKRSSQGRLRQAQQMPYWSQHDRAHDSLRDSLNLNF